MIGPEDTEKSVYAALKMGGQCLRQRRSCRRGLRRALEEGLVKREDIFISTKLWPTLYEKAGAVDKTLERLGVDYVDLLFIHQPAGNYLAGYAAIEQAYRDGKARSLGISNFHGDKLEKLLAHADIKPHVIQLETHPYHVYDDIMARLAEYGTKLMGWYPLGHGDPELLRNPVFTVLADNIARVRRRSSCVGLCSDSSSPFPA